ncbi:MAG TPA: UPF0182 family protein, partial [Chthonomonadales bacterium]|nr:UPF0182 family protein [Chthonomonadales bacterium]
ATYLAFAHWTPFRIYDPVFHNDVGFYIFRLPFYQYLCSFFLGSLAITLAAVVGIHVADRAIQSWAGLPNVRAGVRIQLLALLGALAVVQAISTRLGAYDLLRSDNGVFTGAGYTDLHYRLLAINTEALLLFVTALACLAAMWRGSAFRWPIFGGAAWITSIVLLGNLLPDTVQKISVEPNQLSTESPYIARNIRFTRLGYGLQNVRTVDTFPADESLNAAGLASNRDTLDNVRLWDYNYLGKVYSQLQTVKTYYKFEKDIGDGQTAYNIDIDRYRIGGHLRQVMLAAREMNPADLPSSAQTWQNQRLAYTHGYGLVMSPVNRVVQAGPNYFIEGFPVTVSPEAQGLSVTQPDIYYGELTNDYVFTDTTQQEFDYPSTESGPAAGSAQDHLTTYRGTGGIRIGDSELAKLAFSLRLSDPNILLSRGFTSNTRVLFRRDIRQRLRTIAPFLEQDGDPYLVVEPGTGRLVWIIDCYTISDGFPYSTPHEIPLDSMTSLAPNYIRNSVKATVDAYNGTVNLYISDPKDPMVQTYARVFPGLFKSLGSMPTGLRDHLRYPEDLFRIQRSIYAAYHVDDPGVFYRKDDAWSIPVEPNSDVTDNSGSEGRAPMEPYYVVMRLPEESGGSGNPPREEFLLMSPLAPINREEKNILGWMCARCDGSHYGQLVLYRFPQNLSVNGPSQIISLVNSNTDISKQLSLLRSGGSTANFGNVIVIPVDRSLLYIAPLYVESTSSNTRLPQLQEVVVGFGNRVAMAETLDKALASLFPGYESPGAAQPVQPAPSGAPRQQGPAGSVQALIGQAAGLYNDAESRLKAGDFAGYGAKIRQLGAVLRALQARSAGAPR